MALRNQNSAILVCTTMCLNVSAGEAIHIVKRGETLSTILYDLNLKPIYGRHGALKEALLLNPKISYRKDYRIYPGEKIKLAIVNMEKKISLTEQNRTEQNRTEQNRTEQNRTEQNRTEQNRTEPYHQQRDSLRRSSCCRS